MAAAKGNGRNAGHAAPAKTHTNNTTNFIARCKTLPGFVSVVIAAAVVHAALLAMGAIQ